MASGFVAILTVELHFPEAASLKGKRQFVRSAKDNLRNRFGAAVAEVDHHDLWQRATLTRRLRRRGRPGTPRSWPTGPSAGSPRATGRSCAATGCSSRPTTTDRSTTV